MMGILDLRSLGFYKIKQEVLWEHLDRHYHFKLADNICDQYNRLISLMRKEEENSEGKFPWLEDTDERKHMTDREILDKCEFGQLLSDQDRENTGEGCTMQI